MGGACAPSSSFRIADAVAAVEGFSCVAGAVAMVKLSKEAKQRLQQLFKGGQFAIRWGFIPLVIYLGQWERNLGGEGREGGAETATPCLASRAGERNVIPLCRSFGAVSGQVSSKSCFILQSPYGL